MQKPRNITKPLGRRPLAISDEQIIEALEKSAGMQTEAARKLDMSYDTFWRRVAKSETLKAKITEINERALDFAESKLLQTMKNDSEPKVQLTALIFFLKCKGKRRGYVERQELTGGDGERLFDAGAKDVADAIKSNPALADKIKAELSD